MVSDLCTGTAHLDFAIARLVSDQSEMAQDLRPCDHLFSSCLKYHHEDCLSTFTEVFEAMTISTNTHSRKYQQYGGQVLR